MCVGALCLCAYSISETVINWIRFSVLVTSEVEKKSSGLPCLAICPQISMRMSTHEDDEHEDQDQEINVDSDSRLSCGSNSDVDMDGGGSCYDSETALG